MALSTSGDEGASLEVIEKVAAKEGVDPLELQPPLYDVVNPEALDQIVESVNGEGSVEFQYKGYEVKVSSTGEIKVREKAHI